MIARIVALVALLLATAVAGVAPAAAQDPPANDLLNAVLWMQRSVEYRASAMTAFALARIRLEQALTDPSWTAAPREQAARYQSLPPAVILDIDETLLDNSGYQAWMALKDTTFDPKTWNAYVNTVTSQAIPGAVEFATYAAARGREGVLRLQPHGRGGAGHAEEPREARLSARRQDRHGAECARAARLGLRQGDSPRLRREELPGAAQRRATTSATSSTSTGAPRPSG